MSNLDDYVVIATDHHVEIIGPDPLPEDVAGFCGDVRVYMTKETVRSLQGNVMQTIVGYANEITIVEKIRMTTT